jgi:hypothetical protein
MTFTNNLCMISPHLKSQIRQRQTLPIGSSFFMRPAAMTTQPPFLLHSASRTQQGRGRFTSYGGSNAVLTVAGSDCALRGRRGTEIGSAALLYRIGDLWGALLRWQMEGWMREQDSTDCGWQRTSCNMNGTTK